MARVPEEELQRLKREVSLEQLARAKGIVLKKHGKDLIGLCPFHDDKSPSFVVSPEKNLWHCLGACGKGGSVVDFVMKAENVSFRHAVDVLRSGEPPRSARAGTSTTAKQPPLFSEGDSDEELLEKVVSHYQERLEHDRGARAYLLKRGLLDDDVIKRFQLGFCDRTLGYRMPQKTCSAGEKLRGQLMKLGVLRESGHEHLRGCIIVPLRDDSGKLVQLYGRRVGPSRTTPHLYLSRPLAGVFNADGIKRSDDVILCESLFDALTFLVAGHENVTTSFGTNGLTAEIIDALKASGAKRIFVAYDGDDAGEKAVWDLVERKVLSDFDVYRVPFHHGLDANEYAVAVKMGKRAFVGPLEQAAKRPIAKRASGTPAQEEAAPVVEPAETMPPSAASEVASLAADARPAVAAATSTHSEPLREAAQTVAETPCEIDADEVRFSFGSRRWRIRGHRQNVALSILKVNVLVGQGEAFHVDTFDLYAHKARAVFLRVAAGELSVEESVLKKELGRVLLRLEELLMAMRDEEPEAKAHEMTKEEREEAITFLKRSELLDEVLRDFDRIGVVGEETNKLTGYLAAVSRKLHKPLAVMVQSSSAAGKSSLMDAVLAFVPDEGKVAYSAMTGQSLFYMEDGDLTHKVLAIAEEEGAERAAYALKILQSEGKLKIASTGKDPTTGRHVTSDYEVTGPVAILSTTTAIDVDEELLNRCVVLTVDEGREQTRAIQKLQRERRTLEGLQRANERAAILARHQNAQRLIEPLAIVNPYAPRLTFLDDKTRTRRDHEKYLTLIDTIALLHQHQREVKTAKTERGEVRYVEVELSDIERANELAHKVLGRSLDELPPQTRRLLEHAEAMVEKRCSDEQIERKEAFFTRRELREASGFGNTQLKVHMQRLEELEYVVMRRGGRGQLAHYELLYDGKGQDGSPFLMGLLDVKRLDGNRYEQDRSAPQARWSGETGERSAHGRGQVGPKSGGGRAVELPHKSREDRDFSTENGARESNSTSPGNARAASYVAATSSANGALPASETC